MNVEQALRAVIMITNLQSENVNPERWNIRMDDWFACHPFGVNG